jgi:3-oxoacyl-[acyl-carrier-protein] synthase-3
LQPSENPDSPRTSPDQTLARNYMATNKTDVNAGITGLGMCVPEKVLSNEDLMKVIETNDEWIVSRTGIRERRITDQDTASSDLAIVAANRALEDAGLTATDLDLVLCATATGDFIWPATACIIQDKIGATRAGAFDLSAACSGFCYGMATAAAFIQSGAMRHILVVGVDTLTKQLNWQDRASCILFGDGAGAAIMSPCGNQEGLLASVLGADGSGLESVWMPAGGVRTPLTQEGIDTKQNCITMRGAEVYKFAIRIIPEAIEQALTKTGMKPCDIDLLVMHQANLRIIQSVAERLGINSERVFVNVDRYGNTSAASVPIALTEAQEQGRLNRGDVVATVGFGAGLTWGANVLRWNRGEHVG